MLIIYGMLSLEIESKEQQCNKNTSSKGLDHNVLEAKNTQRGWSVLRSTSSKQQEQLHALQSKVMLVYYRNLGLNSI